VPWNRFSVLDVGPAVREAQGREPVPDDEIVVVAAAVAVGR
jgi:hypothetical protein